MRHPQAQPLHHEVYGRGAATPLLCLHGGGCAGDDFLPLAERLGDARRLICPDLRGHGRSPAPVGDYTPEALAGDVAALLAELGVRRAVLVGHSLGGAVATHLMSGGALEVAALISLDAPMPVTAGMGGGLAMLRDAFVSGDDGMTTMRAFMAQVTGWADDAEAHTERLDLVCAGPNHVMGPLLAAMADFDAGPALEAHRAVPMLHIDTGYEVCDLERLRALRPDAWIGRTAGTGHYPHVESPDQVAAMIAHFLRRHRL
jgi:pimeloyl-ACP methyl ester carboxylesterase